MNTHADKSQENKSQSVSNGESQMQTGGEATFEFEDNRPEAIAQSKIQEMANNSPQVSHLMAFQDMANNSPRTEQAAQLQAMADKNSAKEQEPMQKKGNNTGLPDNLKTGMENLSGISLDDVKVHRNSDKPAQLKVHAYAQGTDIHLGPGQEKHLPHEAWHVVQQKQGRVKPTMQMKGEVNVNDDLGLEKEADLMGARALSKDLTQRKAISQDASTTSLSTIQRVSKEFTRKTGGEDVTNTVTWENGGSLKTLTIDDKSPLIAFLVGDTKSVFNTAKIAKVQENPAKNMIMVYPIDTSHGIWKIDMSGGDFSWKFVGEANSSGRLWWKNYFTKGKVYFNGIENLDNASAIANKIYDNMLGMLSYVPSGSESVNDIISTSASQGQCHVVNSAMGLLIQAGLASKNVDENVAEQTHDSPFLTPDTGATSVIKGVSTNIKTDSAKDYGGHRIKFDNHMWITVGGKVYDLVAGIKGGGASCIDVVISEIEDGKYKWDSKILTKSDTPGAPWISGYDITEGK